MNHSIMSRIRAFLKELSKSPSGAFGFLVIVCLVVAGICAPLLAPFDPLEAVFVDKLLPPGTAGHLLGTDELGRDVLSRMLYGARVSLLVACLSTLLAGTIGLIIGCLAGFLGGFVDALSMRIVDLVLSFPFILLVIIVNALLGSGVKNIVISISVSGWVVYARLVRSEVLKLREREFVAASVTAGLRRLAIIRKHFLPNLITPMTLLISVQMAQYIITEASVSFIGFGVQLPQPSWGNMLSEGRTYIYSGWWLITFPGIAVALTALAISLFGDWARDLLDPETGEDKI